MANQAILDKADERSGWLLKRGKLNHSFQKRWFVLKNNELKYYKNELQGDKEQGVIILEGCSVEISPEAKYRKPFAFELNSPLQSRVFVMVADNGAQLQEWMNAIRRAMLRIRRLRSKTAATEKRDSRRDASESGGAGGGSGGGANGGGSINSGNVGINSASPSKQSQVGGSGQEFSSAASDSVTTPLVAEDNEDENKYDVYRRWLEESKEGKKGSTSAPRDLNQHLLDEGSKGNKCCQNCTIL